MRCKEALRKWRLKGQGDIESAPVEVEVGGILEAEFEANVYLVKTMLEQALAG